jgi:NAD(P)-dependent dehydrogenase (short-subunit alcohol dehydrogenase family)
MQDYAGKVALVTGASRGIGAATARAFAERGTNVVLAARDMGSLLELVDDINAAAAGAPKGARGQARAIGCDVGDYTQVETAVAATLDRFGRLDFLINNAGTIDPMGSIAGSEPADWARALKINLLGPYHGIRAALPVLQAQGQGGAIINISSGAAHNPMEGWAAYCTGKAGAAMLTRAAAQEVEGSAIRIIGLRPGTVETRMQQKIRASGIDNRVSRMTAADHFPPEAPAELICWLCSMAAADLHGQEVDIRMAEIQARAGLRQAS